MTLNLLLVSPKHVYQCSDFRLTYEGGFKTDDEAQKIVAISSQNWSALVQFTGVAKTSAGFDTCKWLANLAKGNLPYKPNAPTSWLIKELLEVERYIKNADNNTFSVVGFQDAKPFAKPFLYLVSNFQRLPDLRVASRRQWKSTKALGRHLAFATGSAASHVTSGELRHMRTLARRFPPSVVHQKLAELNKTVAARTGPNGPISQSCFTGHLGLDGQGWLIPHEVNPGGKYLPEFAGNLVEGHLKLSPRLDENGKELPLRLVQVALKREKGAFMMLAEFQATPTNLRQPPSHT
jgi:hypothetical protein